MSEPTQGRREVELRVWRGDPTGGAEVSYTAYGQLESWRRVLEVNLTGYFVSARAAARQMVAPGDGGRIILTSSIQALLAIPGASAQR